MESFAHATDSDFKRMVGTGRFELPTPRTPSECSTRLSHVPTRKDSTRATVATTHPVNQRRGLLSNSTLPSRENAALVILNEVKDPCNAARGMHRSFGPKTTRA